MNAIATQTRSRTATPTQVIVTEREVILGSAAALLAPDRDARGGRAALTAWLVSLRHEPRRSPRSRRDFTEYSRMARAMERL